MNRRSIVPDRKVTAIRGAMPPGRSPSRRRVISIENLARAKEAMGREKDLLAAKELRAIAEKRRQMTSFAPP